MKTFSMVLSGGGAKGAYQVGAFKALKEFDIKINSVSGSSFVSSFCRSSDGTL